MVYSLKERTKKMPLSYIDAWKERFKSQKEARKNLQKNALSEARRLAKILFEQYKVTKVFLTLPFQNGRILRRVDF